MLRQACTCSIGLQGMPILMQMLCFAKIRIKCIRAAAVARDFVFPGLVVIKHLRR